jgi:hypothetical protein
VFSGEDTLRADLGGLAIEAEVDAGLFMNWADVRGHRLGGFGFGLRGFLNG